MLPVSSAKTILIAAKSVFATGAVLIVASRLADGFVKSSTAVSENDRVIQPKGPTARGWHGLGASSQSASSRFIGRQVAQSFQRFDAWIRENP